MALFGVTLGQGKEMLVREELVPSIEVAISAS